LILLSDEIVTHDPNVEKDRVVVKLRHPKTGK